MAVRILPAPVVILLGALAILVVVAVPVFGSAIVFVAAPRFLVALLKLVPSALLVGPALRLLIIVLVGAPQQRTPDIAEALSVRRARDHPRCRKTHDAGHDDTTNPNSHAMGFHDALLQNRFVDNAARP